MRLWLIVVWLLTLAPAALAEDVLASAPRTISVTIYRAPYRNGGSINLNQLGGFALVTETRLVHLPKGESRLRFEGVVDGIQPSSAIVTGLPGGVIEKNRDAQVLSPEALVRAALGAEVTLVRTNRKTGKVTRTRAAIRSANDDGVTFETADGVEAFRCSGVPETFQFDRVPAGLTSTPTLSVLTRAPQAVTATVTLSYLASGFDWAANYVAAINVDGATLNLGAWITLANGNAVSLPAASTQIVAGRLNRVSGEENAPSGPSAIIATCWPQGTTSDLPPSAELDAGGTIGEIVVVNFEARAMRPLALMAPAPPPPPPPPPPPEQLGDLKLYRVPQATTVAARQSKQVRLLEQASVPFTRLCSADLAASGSRRYAPAMVLLRTKNDLADNLGLPLPSGSVAVFDHGADRDLLIGDVDLRDTAVDEDVELRLGVSPDVQVSQTMLSDTADPPTLVALSPQLLLALHSGKKVEVVEITNARAAPVAFELRLRTYGAAHVTSADQPMGLKDGRPIFHLTVPAGGVVKVQYAVSDR